MSLPRSALVLPRWFLPVFVVLYVLSHLLGLGVMEYRGEEARRVLVSLEMLLSGQYLQPTISGWPYYNKPPLYNWLLAAWMEVVGTGSRFWLRLPSLFALGGIAWLTYVFARRELGRDIALVAMLMVLTGAELYFYGSLLALEMDIVYALVVFGQWMIFYTGWRRNLPLLAFAGSYLLMAAGFMMKGLPSLVFQALTLPAWLWTTGQWRWLWRWEHFAGLAIGLVTSFGYFFGLHLQGGEAGLYLLNLLEESSKKSAGEGSFGKIVIQIFTFPVKGIQLLAPWIIALFFISWRGSWKWFRETPMLRFFAVVFAVNILIYWISPGTRCRYLYMFLPLMATGLAAAWSHAGKMHRKWVMGLALGMVALRLAYSVFLLPVQQKNLTNQHAYKAWADTLETYTALGTLSYAGIPDTLFVNPQIGPLRLANDTILTPPKVPHLTLLEITRRRGEVLRFDTIMPSAGTWLLSNDATLCRRTPLTRFPTFDGHHLFLCKEK